MMQQPDGSLIRLHDEDEARTLAEKLEGLTGKPHPVFSVGEVLEIKGGKWKVLKVLSRGRMVLKTMPYLLMALLLAAPLTAQDTIPLPGQVIVINGDSIFIAIEVNDLSGERIVEVFEALQASLDSATAALRDCDRCEEEEAATSQTTDVVVAVGRPLAIVLFSILGLRKLGQIVDAIRNRDYSESEPEEPKSEGHGEGNE